jgi:MFS family permease
MMNTRGSFLGWRMVALAFAAYNLGLTVVVNSFGPAMLVLQRELGASRAGVSMGFGALMLSMGVLAPVVGNLARWTKLRTLMMTGAALHSVGFLLLAYAGTLTQVLLLYGSLIGAGACMMALITAPTLISRWFDHDRGKALGLGLVQVFALFAAPLAAWLLSRGGRPLLFLSLSALFALLIPVMGLVIEGPDSVGQSPRRLPGAAPAAGIAPLLTSREIFTDVRFWLLSVAIGIFTAGGVAFASHGPAMAVSKGVTIAMGSVILAASGGGALLGAFVFGWLIDRVGPFRALICALTCTAFVWLIFSQVTSLPWLILLGFVMGICMGPTPALHGACIGEIFDPQSFSRVMGYSFFIKMPFLFAPAPLAGRLYDLSGGYGSTYVVFVASLAVAVLLAIVLAYAGRNRMAPPQSGGTFRATTSG